MMLAEAIKMSLLDAQQNGLLDSPQETPERRTAEAGQSPDKGASEPRPPPADKRTKYDLDGFSVLRFRLKS